MDTTKKKQPKEKKQVTTTDESVVLKTNSSFRLKKEYKMRTSSGRISKEEQRFRRRLFIAAQLAEAQATNQGRKGFLEMFKGKV